jgi:ribonuclease D
MEVLPIRWIYHRNKIISLQESIKNDSYSFEFSNKKVIQYIGIDAEWSPNDKRIRLLQVSCKTSVFLIKGFRVIRKCLNMIDRMYDIIKVGCGLQNDLYVFQKNFNLQFHLSSYIDIQQVSKRTNPSLRKIGLAAQVYEHLDVMLNKEINHNLWDLRWFPYNMVVYAANDAIYVALVLNALLQKYNVPYSTFYSLLGVV